MKDLMILLTYFILVNSDLPAPASLPSVEHLPQAELEAMLYVADAGQKEVRARIVALYHKDKRTIYLLEEWSSESLPDESILLHELVHHLQNESGRQYPCAASREREAYDLQIRFLRDSGDPDPLRTIGINDLFLLAVTTCMPVG